LGAGLFGDDRPESSIVAGHGEGEKGFEGSGVEVGEEDGAGVKGKAGGGAAAIGGDIEQELGGVRSGGDVDRGAIDGGAQLDVAETIVRGEKLGFGEGVVKALHREANDGGGAVAAGSGGEVEAGDADGVAVLGDDEAAGLGGGGDEGKKSNEQEEGEIVRKFLHGSLGIRHGNWERVAEGQLSADGRH